MRLVERAVVGLSAVWAAAAFYAAATSRPKAAIILGLTAGVGFAVAWSLRLDPDDAPVPVLFWPGRITMRCRVCGDVFTADSPEVSMWCDTVEAHYTMTHDLTPSVAHGLDAYRATVTMHAQLAASVDGGP